MICGIILTFVVQSSSIILAILTPLVGIGVISLDRAFSVTAGAQIGTTITGLIAALANASAGLENFQVNLNPHTLDRFTPSHARCAENCGSALTHR